MLLIFKPHVLKGEQNLSAQNMSLWHKHYFELILFLKTVDRGEILKTKY